MSYAVDLHRDVLNFGAGSTMEPEDIPHLEDILISSCVVSKLEKITVQECIHTSKVLLLSMPIMYGIKGAGDFCGIPAFLSCC